MKWRLGACGRTEGGFPERTAATAEEPNESQARLILAVGAGKLYANGEPSLRMRAGAVSEGEPAGPRFFDQTMLGEAAGSKP